MAKVTVNRPPAPVRDHVDEVFFALSDAVMTHHPLDVQSYKEQLVNRCQLSLDPG